MCRHNIGIALDNDDLFGFGHLTFGKVDAVEHLRFFVQQRFGGVEVFGSLVVVKETACPESDGFARYGADGPDEAPTKTVVEAAVSFREHTGSTQFLVGKSLGTQMFEQIVPATGGVSNPEGFGGGWVEPASAEKALCFPCVR